MKTLSRDQARAFYNRFGTKQVSQGFYKHPATEEMIRQTRFSETQAVFEFGCGTGRFAKGLLEPHKPSIGQYLGIDLSPVMVELAPTSLRRFGNRTKIQLNDGSLPFNFSFGMFDRFVSNYVFDLLAESEIEAVLAEAERILQVGGFLCLISPSNGVTLGS